MAFGPRIIGKDAYANQQKKVVGRAGFGPRVIGKAGTAANPTPAAIPAGARGKTPTPVIAIQTKVAQDGLSIDQLKTIIAENPSFIESLYLQECERPEGARREALLALQLAAQESGPADLVAEIEELLPSIAPVTDAPVVVVPATDETL